LLGTGVDPNDIVIFDRAVFPRPKLCGGAVTFRGTQRLAELGLPATHQGETCGLDLYCRHSKLHLREPGPQYLYDRLVLDHELATFCRAAGVELREGCTVDGLEPAIDGWRIRTRGAVTPVRWVIGADGAAGFTRRATGLRGGLVGRLQEAVYESAEAPFSADRLHFFFDPMHDGIPGYAWIFPYPRDGRRDLWKIGIMDGSGTVPGGVLRQWLARFAERHGFHHPEERVAGWPEHFYSWRNQAHRPGLLLVGEAHGADPLFGEGITPAIETAVFAAPRLKAALDCSRRTIPFYEWRFALSEEGRNLMLQGLLARRLYGARGHRWLKIFFESERVREFGHRGVASYGRLLDRKADVIATWLGGW
jgi:flavin-dependent dehydrogenase